MKNQNGDFAALFLLSIPILIAISGLISNFNLFDFAYLFLVFAIFLNYCYQSKKQN